MKTHNNHFISLIAAFVLLMGTVSCTTDQHPAPLQSNIAATNAPVSTPVATALNIPELMDRPEGLGTPEERDHMLDVYDNAKLQLELNPKNGEAWLDIAHVFILEARVTGDFGYNYDAAGDILDQLINDPATDENTLFNALTFKATIRLSQHEFSEALEIGERAAKMNPYNAFVYGILVDANVELGHYEEAVAMADKMVSIRPDLRSYSRVSYLREIHGDDAGAIEAMKMAIDAGYPGYEDKAWCRVTLAELYQKQGELNKAEVELRMALAERSNYPYALAGLGVVEMKKGNLGKADELLSQAIALMPNAAFEEDMIRLARLQKNADHEQEHIAKALVAYNANEHAPEHHHHDDDHTHSHGHSHVTGMEIARFRSEFTTDYDLALSNALDAYKVRPNNIDVNLTLARIYYQKTDLEAAKMHLDKAQATGSNNTEIKLLEGLISWHSGEQKAAKKTIEQALQTDPYGISNLADEARMLL